MNQSEEMNNKDEKDETSRPQSSTVAGILLPTMLWGVIGGLVGFIGGFFGPIVLQPSSPQGPLLGIFITGPLGVVIGCVFGAVRAFRQR